MAVAAAGCGGDEPRAASCDRGLRQGAERADGVFFAVTAAGCGTSAARSCALADAAGPIATEHVLAGVALDCVVFSQLSGAGVGAGGECTAVAATAIGGELRHSGGACRGDVAAAAPPDRGSVRIEAGARDPFGRPPGARRGGARVPSPPWAVLVWRSRRRTCFEAGQVLDGRRLATRAAFYAGRRPSRGDFGTELGVLRPDAKFGLGRQFFDVGRFLPYPVGEGGSCGEPGTTLFSRTVLHARDDLAAERTVVAGVAGDGVREVRGGGRRLRLSGRSRAFVATFRGDVDPKIDRDG